MYFSETTKEIFPALVKARSELKNPKATSDNPYFKSRYADLTEIIEGATKVLADNGLVLTQSPVSGGCGDRAGVETAILHKSGEWIKFGDYEFKVAGKRADQPPTPQDCGSAITYARRYAISAVLFLATDYDDDANAVSGKYQNAVEHAKTVEQPKALTDGQKEHIKFLRSAAGKDKRLIDFIKTKTGGKKLEELSEDILETIVADTVNEYNKLTQEESK